MTAKQALRKRLLKAAFTPMIFAEIAHLEQREAEREAALADLEEMARAELFDETTSDTTPLAVALS